MNEETYEICDRCGGQTIVGERKRNVVDVFVLCGECMAELRLKEDRLDVLEGFVEEVDKLARPITKI